MPTDTKRLPVPEDSINPVSYCPSDRKSNKNILDGGGNRSDGRTVEQMRPLYLKTGVITQAKGSAYLEMNKTKIICAVYGPREVTKKEDFSMKGQLYCEMKFATFSCANRRQHQQDTQEKEFSTLLQGALEPAVCLDKFPKARMDVFVTVLEDDGSALAGAMSCASVALAAASVEMYDLVVGCSMRQFGQEKIMDPTHNEEYTTSIQGEDGDNGAVTVGYMPSLNQVSGLTQTGELHSQTAIQAIKSCISSCQKLYPVLQQCLVKAVQQKMESDKT